MRPYYEDGAVMIYLGDARDILPQIPSASVDFIFTDPPYGHNQNDGDLAHNREKALGLVKAGRAVAGAARPIANDGFDAANDLAKLLFRESARLLRHGCCCCCCCAGGGPDPQFARWSLWMDDLLGFKHAVVWDKGGLGMGWHYRRNYEFVLVGEKPGGPCKWYGGTNTPNVLRLTGIKPTVDDHPTPKPMELAAWFISKHTQPGDLVLDPFSGGGSTLEAAKLGGRRAIGIEIEERWCALTVERLKQSVLPLCLPRCPCEDGPGAAIAAINVASTDGDGALGSAAVDGGGWDGGAQGHLFGNALSTERARSPYDH